MPDDPETAAQLLPDQPGWTAGPASLARHETGPLLMRRYARGRSTAAVEVMAGPAAAAIVARTMDFPAGTAPAGQAGGATWMVRGRKAHLVRSVRGMVYHLGIILRGGAGDLPGSVMLTVKGRGLPPAVAIELVSALDWDAITAALAGGHPRDPARMAAASEPAEASASAGSPLWPMLPSLRSMETMLRLEQRRPPRFAVANQRERYAAAIRTVDERHAGSALRDRDRHYFAAIPTPVLAVHHPSFAPDYIWPGLHFASARFRDALALGPDVIAYREVDASGSTAAVRAADYRIFRAVQEADPVDLRRMYGHEPDRDVDGNPTTAWLLSVSGPHAAPRRTVWREGFVPPAPLFRDRTGRLLATDALAEQIMRAGFPDVLFQDVTSEAALHGVAARPDGQRGKPRG